DVVRVPGPVRPGARLFRGRARVAEATRSEAGARGVHAERGRGATRARPARGRADAAGCGGSVVEGDREQGAVRGPRDPSWRVARSPRRDRTEPPGVFACDLAGGGERQPGSPASREALGGVRGGGTA